MLELFLFVTHFTQSIEFSPRWQETEKINEQIKTQIYLRHRFKPSSLRREAIAAQLDQPPMPR